MKKLLPLLFSLSIIFSLNAQKIGKDSIKPTKQYIPTEGYFGVSMSITGLINNIGLGAIKDPLGSDIILLKRYTTDKSVIRMGFGIKTVGFKSNSTDSIESTQVIIDSTYAQSAVYLNPGYEYHLLDDSRLDPYIGTSLSLGFIGRTKYQSKTNIVDTTGSNKTDVNYQQDGGFSVGVNAMFGFNYFIARNLSLGAEYQIGLSHSNIGGDWERVTVYTPISGNPISKREIGAERSSVTSVDLSSRINLTLSYFF